MAAKVFPLILVLSILGLSGYLLNSEANGPAYDPVVRVEQPAPLPDSSATEMCCAAGRDPCDAKASATAAALGGCTIGVKLRPAHLGCCDE